MSRILFAFALLFAVGCAHKHHKDHEGQNGAHQCGGDCPHHKDDGGKVMCDMTLGAPAVANATAEAKVAPLGKSKIKGEVMFLSAGEDLKVSVRLSGLKANQKQGFHIHEYGNCASKDGSSAGGHFNPTKDPHAGTVEPQRHMGDLGNLTADAQGNVSAEIVAPKTRLNAILGRAVVVHANEDDLHTQPAGAAGDRVACGVIGLTQ